MTKREQFIADCVRERRVKLGLAQDTGTIGGPSRTVVSKAERLGELPKSAVVRAKLCRALQWEPKGCDVLEKGKVPEEMSPDFTPAEMREALLTLRYTVDYMLTRLGEE